MSLFIPEPIDAESLCVGVRLHILPEVLHKYLKIFSGDGKVIRLSLTLSDHLKKVLRAERGGLSPFIFEGSDRHRGHIQYLGNPGSLLGHRGA